MRSVFVSPLLSLWVYPAIILVACWKRDSASSAELTGGNKKRKIKNRRDAVLRLRLCDFSGYRRYQFVAFAVNIDNLNIRIIFQQFA